MLKSMSVRLTALVFACMVSAAALAYADTPKAVNVPSGDLVPALEALAKQCGVDVIYPSVQLKGLKTQGVSGTLEPKEAFRRLIEGTPLILKEQGGAVLIAFPSPASTNSSTSDHSNPAAQDQQKEGKRDSSGDFRVAQAAAGQAQGNASVEPKEEASKTKPAPLQEVIVTGSRIPARLDQTPQDVKTYSGEAIRQSGQTTLSDFLNTLPDVALASGESNLQTGQGATTVSLHGLPVGTTLILINGRRLEVSGSQAFSSFFDLNNIPLGAVERIEVLSEGSSAIYGSDAIGGVVNIILRGDFNGFEANAKYGSASDIADKDVNFGWGLTRDRGGLSIIGTYQKRGELEGFDRSITGNNDYRRFGAADARFFACNPGNVFSPSGANLPGLNSPFAAVPTGFTGQPTVGEFSATAGTLNACSLGGYTAFIPATQRFGFSIYGHYSVSPSLELFTEVLTSHVEQDNASTPPLLYGAPAFQSFTMSASNPYNPFGEQVGVGGLLTSAGRQETPTATTFVRALVGLKGDIAETWHWETAIWHVQDWENYAQTNWENATAVQNALDSTNPATALNPLVDGPYASSNLLSSMLYTWREEFGSGTEVASAFAHGRLYELPAGSLEAVIGAEYDHDRLSSFLINNPFQPPDSRAKFERNRYAMFAEARVPILGAAPAADAGDMLDVSLAGRYDHYSDFGDKVTPQFGLEFRPIRSLLLRATYADAFRAPSLSDLHFPSVTFQLPVSDPANGNQQEIATVTEGGNPNLKSEKGLSRTVGLVYSSGGIGKLRLSVTGWEVDETNSIQFLDPQTIVNNAALFPGGVTRNSAGLISTVFAGFVNFGTLRVSGIDFQGSFDWETGIGSFRPFVSATDTTRYSAALLPGVAPTTRLNIASDDGLWAPRWKGSASIAWTLGPYSAAVTGRYIGSYQDYDVTRRLGNFWLTDATFKYQLGSGLSADSFWHNSYAAIGAVNLFNRLPDYSNYFGGGVGYDPATADLRGRFLYIQLGGKW